MKYHKITFPDTHFETVELPEGPFLSDFLTAKNSPVLFGCRSGICGTCLIEIVSSHESLSPPSELEIETLQLFAPDHPTARLACQFNLTECIAIKKLKSE